MDTSKSDLRKRIQTDHHVIKQERALLENLTSNFCIVVKSRPTNCRKSQRFHTSADLCFSLTWGGAGVVRRMRFSLRKLLLVVIVLWDLVSDFSDFPVGSYVLAAPSPTRNSLFASTTSFWRSYRPRLVPSRFLCVLGLREDWGLGWGACGRRYFSFFPSHETPRAPNPNLLSLPKHINSDWIRVWYRPVIKACLSFPALYWTNVIHSIPQGYQPMR